MLNLPYFLDFGKWDLVCNVEFGLGDPTLVGSHPWSWQLDGLSKILSRSWQDCFLHVILLLCAFAMI